MNTLNSITVYKELNLNKRTEIFYCHEDIRGVYSVTSCRTRTVKPNRGYTDSTIFVLKEARNKCGASYRDFAIYEIILDDGSKFPVVVKK